MDKDKDESLELIDVWGIGLLGIDDFIGGV